MTDQPDWAKNTGLNESKTRVQLYCNQSRKTTWVEEANDKGFPSTSKYLLSLIREARAYHRHDIQHPRQDDAHIQDLENRIAELEAALEQERQADAAMPGFDDPAVVKRFVTDEFRSIGAIVQQLAASGAANDVLWTPVENQLYFLVAQNEAVYDRRFGFKQADEGAE